LNTLQVTLHYVVADSPLPTTEAFAKFSTLRQAILQEKKGIKHYRSDFIDSCIAYADRLRVRTGPDLESFGQRVLEDCGKLKAIRDHLCDWVLLEGEITNQQELSESVIEVLERLRELTSRPSEVRSWNDVWFEAHRIFAFETFLYIIAALLKVGAHQTLHEIYTSNYLIPATDRQGQDSFQKFDCFWAYSETLQPVLAPEGRKLNSPAAELLKRQADREDLPFSEIMQAELLTLLLSFITPDVRWYPQTLHYASYGDGFPFFMRAAQHKNFAKISKITGIESADELREKVKEGHERAGTDRWHTFHFERDFWSSMNMENLDTLK